VTDLHPHPVSRAAPEKYIFRRRLPFDSNSKSNRFFVFYRYVPTFPPKQGITRLALTAMNHIAYDMQRGCPTQWTQNTFKALLSELVRFENRSLKKRSRQTVKIPCIS